MEGLDENLGIPSPSDFNSSFLFSSDPLGNSSHNLSTRSVPFHGSSTLLTAVIYLVVFVVGLAGNTLAIYVVVRYAKMKCVTNIYILNLAVADELYILGLPFLTTQNVLSYWPFGSFLCRVVMTADSMNQFTSIFCLTVMSIDRYLAVVHPIRSTQWRNPRVARMVSVLMWAVSFVVVLPVFIFSDIQETFNSCNMIWPEPRDVWSTVFILYTAILGFFGPLLIICLCYLLIVIKVKSSGVRAGFMKQRRSERKVNRMVVVIVLVFVLCWLPFFTINIVNLVVIIPESSVTAGIYFFVVILSYANSCANPLLYCFLSDNLKQNFRKVLGVSWCKTNDNTRDHRAPPTSCPVYARNAGIQLSTLNRTSHDPLSSKISPQPSSASHTAGNLRCCISQCQYTSAFSGPSTTVSVSTAAHSLAEPPPAPPPPTRSDGQLIPFLVQTNLSPAGVVFISDDSRP